MDINNIDDTIELRNKCFNLLMYIAETQMEIARNIKGAKNVTDFSLYLQKCNTRLTALSNARMTLESIIKNIDNHTELLDTVSKIEAALKGKDGDV